MAGDDLFQRYLEIGASVLGMSRERAEAIVRDLVASGEVAKGQAAKAADWLVERGRAGTEEMAELVRREIRQQITQLGLATREDLAGLEAELVDLRAELDRMAPGPAGPPPAPAGASEPPVATKAPAAKKRAAARTAEADPAGTGRSGTGRRRTGPGGSGGPDAAPPAGGAVPPKG